MAVVVVEATLKLVGLCVVFHDTGRPAVHAELTKHRRDT